MKWKMTAFWGKRKRAAPLIEVERAAVVKWKRAALWRDMSSGKERHFGGIGQVEKGGNGM